MLEFVIRRPIIMTVAILIICLLGITAIFRVPIQMIPDLDPRVITVQTRWPGATPQDVEKEILLEQEQYLRAIPNLKRMISHADMGSASIELEFSPGVEINDALIRVNNALSQVPGYPENVDEPSIEASSFSDNAFMYFSVFLAEGNPQNLDLALQRDWIEDNVKIALERVPGVADVSVSGFAPQQVSIFVDPGKLAERNISLLDVRNAIRSRNRDISGGDLDAGKRRYILRTMGRFTSIDEIKNLVIAERNGAFIRLSDVGHAEMSLGEVRSFSYALGNESLGFSIRKVIGSNVIEVMDGVMVAVDELNQGIVAERGLRLVLRAEDVRYVKDSVEIVGKNLLIGALLAVAVLYLFLRSPSATLVGAIGIPTSTIAAFLGLLLMGRTINVISLAGVAFAIGMTLDNSIVALENIARHMAKGKDRLTAAHDGIREVWPAILASTLTTVFVFLPVLFVQLEAGQLYSDIAVAISASILMSMLVAIAIIPAACSRYLKLDSDKLNSAHSLGYLGALHHLGSAFGNRLLAFVEWILYKPTRRYATLGITMALALAIIQFMTPKAEYLPEGEEAKIFAMMIAPPGYNLETMQAIQEDFYPEFAQALGATEEQWRTGETAYPPVLADTFFGNNSMAMLIAEPVNRAHTDDLIEAVDQRFNSYPGMRAFATRGSIFSSSDGGTRSINLEVSAPDMATLFGASLEIFRRAENLWEGTQVNSDPGGLTLAQPMLQVQPDWERAAELRIDPGDLGYSIWAYTDGAFVDEFFVDDSKMDMVLYSTEGTIENPQDLSHLMLYSPNGGMVPLSSVATVIESVNSASIRRVDGKRTVTINIIPPREIALEQGVEVVRNQLVRAMREEGALPTSVSTSISGASDNLTQTKEALLGNFLLAIAISYLLMVAIFSHWGYPLIIMTTVPIGISGGIIGFVLLNFFGGQMPLLGMDPIQQPFDVITMLGFLILIGTVINNPILITERTVQNLREGGELVASVLEATRTRLRPIMMSTITTVFGLSPLVFNPGAGTELYRGLGAIVMFGLLVSTLVTLTFMPALLTTVLNWKKPASAEPVSAPLPT